MKLPIRCSQFAWPRMCENRPTYDWMLSRCGYATNHCANTLDVCDSKKATTAAIANVRTTGALYVIRSLATP